MSPVTGGYPQIDSSRTYLGKIEVNVRKGNCDVDNLRTIPHKER